MMKMPRDAEMLCGQAGHKARRLLSKKVLAINSTVAASLPGVSALQVFSRSHIQQLLCIAWHV